MDASLRYLRLRLKQAGLFPSSRLARAACYLLGLDVLLFGLRMLFAAFHSSYGDGLNIWIDLLSFASIALFLVLGFRWLKSRMLWRLRNRLIVTYVFIGVIPALLLITMGFIATYLFAGQFANFVVASELKSRLRSLESVNAAVGNVLAARLQRGESPSVDLPRRSHRVGAAPNLRLERRAALGVLQGQRQTVSACAAGIFANAIQRNCSRSGPTLSSRRHQL